jgi:hypothetical protein
MEVYIDYTYSRTGCNHVFNVVPRSASLKLAAAPPHFVCPHTTTFLTFKCVTAYSTTLAALTSSGCTQFAIFLCTKISPGAQSHTVVSGMRESAQPIQSISGHWPFVRSEKAFGFASEVFCAKCLFPATMRSMGSKIR